MMIRMVTRGSNSSRSRGQSLLKSLAAAQTPASSLFGNSNSNNYCCDYSTTTATLLSATTTGMVQTELNHPSGGIVTVTMQSPPVNSLSMEMCQALSAAVHEAESDPSIQALILRSSNPSIFSAGLDFREFRSSSDNDTNKNNTRLADFWRSFQQLYLDLYGSRLACIAAMEGHAPAAGCMLALSCDYRIMASTSDKEKPKIGLNESKLGIVAPPFLAQQLIDTIGRRRAELALALGILYSPEEALTMELVDEVVDKALVIDAAQQAALTWAKIPAQARVASKMLIRKDRLDQLRATQEQDIADFVGFITSAKVQKALAAYLEQLSNKKK